LNKKLLVVCLTIFLAVGIMCISGCTSSASCPECGSSNVEDAGPYTSPTTDKEMNGYICRDCDYHFGVEK